MALAELLESGAPRLVEEVAEELPVCFQDGRRVRPGDVLQLRRELQCQEREPREILPVSDRLESVDAVFFVFVPNGPRERPIVFLPQRRVLEATLRDEVFGVGVERADAAGEDLD